MANTLSFHLTRAYRSEKLTQTFSYHVGICGSFEKNLSLRYREVVGCLSDSYYLHIVPHSVFPFFPTILFSPQSFLIHSVLRHSAVILSVSCTSVTMLSDGGPHSYCLPEFTWARWQFRWEPNNFCNLWNKMLFTLPLSQYSIWKGSIKHHEWGSFVSCRIGQCYVEGVCL